MSPAPALPSAAIAQVAQSQVRRRVAATVVLTVVIAFAAGLSLALIAGSRRSGSALDRALAQTTQFDLQVSTEMTADEVAALPGVEEAALNPYLLMRVVLKDARLSPFANTVGLNWEVAGGLSRIVKGTLPDGSDPLSAIINEAAARAFAVGPGDNLVVHTFGVDQGESVFAGDFIPTGPAYTLHVAAVSRSLQDLSHDEVTGPSQLGNFNEVIVSNDFYLEHRAEFLTFGDDYQIKLDDPAAVEQFQSAFTQRSTELGLEVDPESFSAARGQVGGEEALRSPIGVETTLLFVLGLLTAGAGLVVVTQLVRTDQRLLGADSKALQALGFTRAQLAAVTATRVLPAAALGSLGAVTIAVLASTLFPVGLGRLVDPTAGVDVNLAVLITGALSVIVAVVGIGAAVGLVASTRPIRTRVQQRPRRAAFLSSEVPTRAIVGARLMFDRASSNRLSTARQTILGGGVAVALMIGVGGYASSLNRLYENGREHGFPWDAMVGNFNFALTESQLEDLRNDPNIAASALAVAVEQSVIDDSHVVSVWAQDTPQDSSQGGVDITVLRGRAPQSSSEIALGAGTLRDLGRDIGDIVRVKATSNAPATSMTVVGVVVLLGSPSGSGALMTRDGLAVINPDAAPQFDVVRFGDDVDHKTAVARLIDAHDLAVTTELIPAQVANLWRVRSLPIFGAITVALLGAVFVAYTLAGAARSQSKDRAVLRALGMTSSDVRAVASWQGLLIASAILVIGAPLGLVIGAAVWRSIADRMGVSTTVTISPWVALLVPVVVTITVLATSLSAHRQRSMAVATVLRVE